MPSCCVFTPFLGRLDQVRDLAACLLEQLDADTTLLLLNDGGDPVVAESELATVLADTRVFLEHVAVNRGVSAARNRAIAWCRERGVDLLVMIDSDCQVGEDFLRTHRELHARHPEVACFGGGVEGCGRTFWARIDKITSWVHSVPAGEPRPVLHPYHLPTTNFSIRLSALAGWDPIFDERLNTGEDALLIRRLRAAGAQAWFSPRPVVRHHDRERFRDVLAHHYAWGHHQYFIQLNNDLSPRAFNPLFRALFLLVYVPCIPLYAVLGCTLNLLPWRKLRPAYLLAAPAVYLLWLAKGVAVAEAALRPSACLRTP